MISFLIIDKKDIIDGVKSKDILIWKKNAKFSWIFTFPMGDQGYHLPQSQSRVSKIAIVVVVVLLCWVYTQILKSIGPVLLSTGILAHTFLAAHLLHWRFLYISGPISWSFPGGTNYALFCSLFGGRTKTNLAVQTKMRLFNAFLFSIFISLHCTDKIKI